jgi:cytochrome P450
MLRVVLGTTHHPNDDVSTTTTIQEQQLANDIEIWSRGLLAAPLAFLLWSTASKAVRARRRIVSTLQDIMKKQAEEDVLTSKCLLAKLMAAKGEDGKEFCRFRYDNVRDHKHMEGVAENTHWKSYLQAATYEQVKRFVMLVMESYPPAPFSMRRTMKDIQVGQIGIPANWLVVYCFAGVLLSRTPLQSTFARQGVRRFESLEYF